MRRNLLHRGFGLLVTASLLAGGAPAQARPLSDARAACSVSFDDDAGDGAWSTAENWSTQAVPGAGDDVCIPSGFPIVSVSGPAPAIRSLDAPATSLSITGALTVASSAQLTGLDIGGTASFGEALTATSVNLRTGGSLGGTGAMTIKYLEWSGGTLAGSGTTIVSDGALRLRGAATKQLSGRTLDVRAASDVTGTGPVQLASDARVEIASTLTLQGEVTLGGTAGAIHVAPGGTLAKTLSGTATVGLPLDNDGLLDVSAGTLKLTAGSGVSTGAYAVAAGAALQWAAGSFALGSPRSTGPGTLRVDGATVTTSGTGTLASVAVTLGSLVADGALSADAVSLGGGEISGAGAIAAGRLDWSAGTLAGSGTATVGPGGLGLTGDAVKVLVDRTLVLNGDSRLDGQGELQLDGAAQVENAGRFDLHGDVTLSGGLLVNRGVLIKTAGAGAATLASPVDNDGIIQAALGTVRMTGGSGPGEISDGTYAIAAGTAVEWRTGAYTLRAPSATGAGSALVSGASLTVSGAASFVSLAVSAGGAHFTGDLSAGTTSVSGGTLTGAAAMTLGRLDWTGGALAGAGTATVGAGGLRLDGTAVKALRDRTLVLSGPSVLSGAGTLQLSGTARLRNRALFDVRSDLSIAGAGAFDNEAGATLRKSAGEGTTTLALPLDNAGTVDVRTGRLQLNSLANFDPASRTLTGGLYDVTGTLTVTGLDVVHNAATIRLHGTGHFDLQHLAENSGRLELLDGATLTTNGYTQTDGTTLLDGGTLDAGAPVDIAGGALEGTGSVRPGLRNAAAVAPGATLHVLGDYTQTSAGALRMAIGQGRLSVSGHASLAGRFEASADFTPAAGAVYELLRAGSVAGAWETETVPDAFLKDFGSTGLSVIGKTQPLPTVIPTPTATATPESDDIRAAENSTLPPAAPPIVEKQTLAELAGGKVLVKLPASGDFVPLKGAASLPTGTVVDARGGSVTFTAAGSYGTAPSTPTTITVASAIFQIRQIRARDNRTAVTDLVLKTAAADVKKCARRPPPKGLVVRKLKATAKGLVRTIAGASVLTTRNASWRVDDRCDGTRVRVSKGRGSAFNRLTGRTRSLHARQAYLARARLFAARKLQLRAAPRP